MKKMDQLISHAMVLLGVVWLALLASIVPPDIPVMVGIFLAGPGLCALACGLLRIIEE